MFDDRSYLQPWPIQRFDVLDSTNLYASNLAQSRGWDSCWIQANSQTSGKGRLGRSWQSAQGNLFATALFKFAGDMAEAPLVCFAAGLAASDAIDSLFPSLQADIRLKWPNDIVVGPRKLGGILIETGTTDHEIWMAVGFGVNLCQAPVALDRPTIALADLPTAPAVEPIVFLSELDIAFRRRMCDLARTGFSPIRQDWLQRTVHTGGALTYTLNGKQQTGTFYDLADDGALVVRDESGKTHHVRAGDVGLIG